MCIGQWLHRKPKLEDIQGHPQWLQLPWYLGLINKKKTINGLETRRNEIIRLIHEDSLSNTYVKLDLGWNRSNCIIQIWIPIKPDSSWKNILVRSQCQISWFFIFTTKCTVKPKIFAACTYIDPYLISVYGRNCYFPTDTFLYLCLTKQGSISASVSFGFCGFIFTDTDTLFTLF